MALDLYKNLQFKDRAKQAITQAKISNIQFRLEDPPAGYQALPFGDDDDGNPLVFDCAIVCQDGQWQVGAAIVGYDGGGSYYYLEISSGEIHDNSQGDQTNIAKDFGFDTNNAEVFLCVSADAMNKLMKRESSMSGVAAANLIDEDCSIADSTGGPQTKEITLTVPWKQPMCPIDISVVDISVALRIDGGLAIVWSGTGNIYFDISGSGQTIDITMNKIADDGTNVTLAVDMDGLDVKLTFTANGEGALSAFADVSLFARAVINQNSCW